MTAKNIRCPDPGVEGRSETYSSKKAGSKSMVLCRGGSTAALLIRMWISWTERPWSVFWIIVLPQFTSFRSVWISVAVLPSSLIWAATFSAEGVLVSLRYTRASLAPRLASSTAMPAPMPREAPVTMATFLARERLEGRDAIALGEEGIFGLGADDVRPDGYPI